MGRSALVSESKINKNEGDQNFYKAKITTARFFGDHVLSQAPGLSATVAQGAASVMALTDEQFLAA